MFPGIAHVHVEVDRNHEAAGIVVNGVPGRGPGELRRNAAAGIPIKMSAPGYLGVLVEVEHHAHQGVIDRQRLNAPLRKRSMHDLEEYGPVPFAVEVIDDQETAAGDVLPEPGDLDIG